LRENTQVGLKIRGTSLWPSLLRGTWYSENNQNERFTTPRGGRYLSLAGKGKVAGEKRGSGPLLGVSEGGIDTSYRGHAAVSRRHSTARRLHTRSSEKQRWQSLSLAGVGGLCSVTSGGADFARGSLP